MFFFCTLSMPTYYLHIVKDEKVGTLWQWKYLLLSKTKIYYKKKKCANGGYTFSFLTFVSFIFVSTNIYMVDTQIKRYTFIKNDSNNIYKKKILLLYIDHGEAHLGGTVGISLPLVAFLDK